MATARTWATAAGLAGGIIALMLSPIPFPGRYTLFAQGTVPMTIKMDTWTGRTWAMDTAELFESTRPTGAEIISLPSFWEEKWGAIEADERWKEFEPQKQAEVKRFFLKTEVESTEWFKGLPPASRKEYIEIFLSPNRFKVKEAAKKGPQWTSIP